MFYLGAGGSLGSPNVAASIGALNLTVLN